MSISREWAQSKAQYYADFISVPIIMVIAVLVGGFNLSLFLIAFVVWTYTEYLIHRYLFHITFRNEHWLHHINEFSYVGLSAWYSTSIFVALSLVSWYLGTLQFFTGYIFGYYCYIVIHDAIHHKNFLTRLMPRLKYAHEIHHRQGIEANFGVTTPFWDILFDTYQVKD